MFHEGPLCAEGWSNFAGPGGGKAAYDIWPSLHFEPCVGAFNA